MTFANSFDPVQARHNVGPDLDPNCLTLTVFLKEFFEKVEFEKKSMKNYTVGKELTAKSTNYGHCRIISRVVASAKQKGYKNL